MSQSVSASTPPRLKERYRREIASSLQDDLGLSNLMQVPCLEKIVVNMGIGGAIRDRKQVGSAMEELALIAGQKPRLNLARKSVAGFKIRKGMPVGVSVTLRGDRMWEFFDRLTTIALPRVRDFRGVSSRAFDGRGNYSLGIREQIIFPEISYDRVDAIRGMNIVICTTARTNEEARALLGGLNMPFER